MRCLNIPHMSSSKNGSSMLSMINQVVVLSLLMSTAIMHSVSSQALSVHQSDNTVISMNLKEPTCNFVVEVFHLQDFSASFYDDLSQLQMYLPIFLADLDATFPGSTYGVGTFVDKPLTPFGMPYEGHWFEGDWCLNVTSAISSTDPQIVTDILTSGIVGAGFDDPENQIGAIHDIALDAELVGWTNRVVDDRGFPVMRVISVSTDAVFHAAPEGVDRFGGAMRPNDGDKTTECSLEDYPSVEQVGSALKHRNAYTIVLVGSMEGEMPNEDAMTVYQQLLNSMEVRGGVYPISADSGDFISAMQIAFDEMSDRTCVTPVLDVVFSHDVTYSYKNDLPMLHDRIADLTATLQNEYVAPRFALTTFGDKPMLPLGHAASGDYCFRLHQSLTYMRQELLDATANIKTTSGVDWKESQLDGIISSVLEPTMGWRLGETWNGFQMLRVVVLATDSGFHTSTDAADAGFPLAPHTGGMVRCLEEEYPSLDQLAQALLANDVHPLFVPTRDIAGIYRRLLKYLEDNHNIIGAVSELQDFGELKEVVPKGIRRLKSKLDSRHKNQQQNHGSKHSSGHSNQQLKHHHDSVVYGNADDKNDGESDIKEIVTG